MTITPPRLAGLGLVVTAAAGAGCIPCTSAPPPISACASNDLSPGDDGAALSVSGVVTAIETASDGDTCIATGGVGRGFTTGEPATVIVLEGDDGVTRVALQGIDVDVAPGDALRVDYAFVFGGFGPDEGRLVLADDAGTLLYAEEAGHLDRFTPPDGLDLSRGRQLCWTRDTCGAWSRSAVVANGVELGEAPVVVGGLALRSTGFELQDENQTISCPDWFVARALVWGTRE